MSQLNFENTGIPTVPSQFRFSTPVKHIHDSQGLQWFQQSTALSELQQSLGRIVVLVEGKAVPDTVLPNELLYDHAEIENYTRELTAPIPTFEKPEHELDSILKRKPFVKAIVELISKLSQLVDQVPPFPGPRRYGNMACREWHTELEANIDEWMKELILPLYAYENSSGFLEEVKWYIVNAFGSKERLDYGTGHELAYLAFLTGLWKSRVIGDDVDGSDFLVMFGVYYNLTRKLILTYTLEPAGSHGVWGLDDHFHIIYILGASQMLGGTNDETSSSSSSKNRASVSPKLISNRSVVFQYSSRNLYFNAVAFIYKVKKGAFFEHSPLLYDVSNVKSWEKILKGMLKMYQAEVFGKFPVVQHFYFGTVFFPWTNAKTGEPLPISTSEESTNEKETREKLELTPPPSQPPLVQPVTTPTPITTIPWKKPSSSSFQEAVTKSTLGRPSNTPQMPMPSTRAPWANAKASSSSSSSSPSPRNTSPSQLPTTKAPSAK